MMIVNTLFSTPAPSTLPVSVNRNYVSATLLVGILLAPSTVHAEDVTSKPGIASCYKHDLGIGEDPAVVFVETFEDSSIESIGRRWDTVRKYLQTAAGGDPFEGLRFRTSEKLNVNFLWLYLYITKGTRGHANRIWFDDVVVATDYIGPSSRK